MAEGTINPATGQAYQTPPISDDERAYRAAWFNARTDAEWFRPVGMGLYDAFQFRRIAETTSGANQWTSANIGSFKNTADISSKGTELELTANITSNWRVAVNAARSIAQQTNVLDAAMDRYIDAFKVVALDGYQPSDQGGPVTYWHRTGFAQIDEWGDEGTGGNAQFLGSKWVTNTYVPYLTAKASNGRTISELPKYTANFITSYDFKHGRLKGFGIGGAIRYSGRYAIGYYPIYNAEADAIVADLDSPIYAKSEISYDMWFSYRRKLTSKINGVVQLNLRDLFAGHRLIPISSNPDGTYGQYRMGATTSWELTTRLEF
jgi:outer membrane receptor for ferric coprogen and ferric-rhodotorulic acid